MTTTTATASSPDRQVAHFSWRSAPREARRRARRCRAVSTVSGSPRPAGATRSRCSRSRRPPGSPELVPIRYGRMLVSPFTFYRGAAYLMAADLAGSPRTGLHAQLCGDAHLSNFGAFAAPDRRAGLRRQRLRRDAAGAVRVGRQAARRELRRRRPRPRLRRGASAVASSLAVTRAYREAMRDLAAHARPRRLVLAHRRRRRSLALDRRAASREAAQAARQATWPRRAPKDSLRAFAKLTRDGRRRAAHHQRPAADRADRGARRRRGGGCDRGSSCAASIRRLPAHAARRPATSARAASATSHAARKVVGVGSVGTRAWIVLLLGRDDEDPLFLQVKEAQAFGARAVPRQERVRQPRPARGRGPAADAGRQRHHARLGPGRRARRRRARLLRPPAVGPEGLGDRSSCMDPTAHGDLRPALRLDAGPRPRPLGRPRRDRRLPGRGRRPSTGRWPTSPRPTPTRTSATTRRIARGRQQRPPQGADRPVGRRALHAFVEISTDDGVADEERRAGHPTAPTVTEWRHDEPSPDVQ